MLIPEDEANSSLATGFQLEMNDIRRMQILPVAGGWRPVLEQFCSVQIELLRRYPERSVILALDLDGYIDRLQQVKTVIPEELKDRVYVLSVLSEPEDLKRLVSQKLEDWGCDMGRGCNEIETSVWANELLRHNLPELRRMKENGLIDFLLA